MSGTSQRIYRANAARAGRVCARWWIFHATAAPKTPNLLELVYLQRGPLRTPRSILADTQEHRAHSRALSTPNALLSANDTRERLTTDHTRRHTIRSPLAHAERLAHKNNIAPTNEGIRRGGVESFGAQCSQKIGKVRTQSR